MHAGFLHKVYDLICNSFGGETVGDQKSFWLYSQQGAYWFFFYSLFSYYTFVVIYTKSQTHPSLNITCRIIRKICNNSYCHDSTDKSKRITALWRYSLVGLENQNHWIIDYCLYYHAFVSIIHKWHFISSSEFLYKSNANFLRIMSGGKIFLHTCKLYLYPNLNCL